MPFLSPPFLSPPFLSLTAPLAATATDPGSGTSVLAVLAIGAVVAWLLSLLLHPFTACSACKGNPRSFGAVATKSFRLCGVCGGSGRRRRVGARLWQQNRD